MDDRYRLRQLTPTDAAAVALIHRLAFDQRLPWLAGRHSPAEDQWFFRERVFPACEVWGVSEGSTVKGFIAFRENWVDHLYVLPDAQGQGLGSALLAQAQTTWPRLSLWTFQRNWPARRFYEARGFVLVKETDGADNEEREPDALYAWLRQSGGHGVWHTA